VTTGPSRLPVVERLDLVGLLSLRREWDELLASSPLPSPFQSWPWVEAWLDTIGVGTDLEVVAARDPVDGALLGVAPFAVVPVRRYGVGFRALRLVAAGVTGTRSLDMPVRTEYTESVAPALWEALDRERRWDLVDLSGLAAEGTLAGVLLRRRADASLAASIPVHHIDLQAGTLDAMDDGAGSLGVRLVVEPGEVHATLARLARIAHRPRRSGSPRASLAHPAVLAFHRRAAERLLDAGRLRLWRLDVGGRVVAATYAMRFGDTVACHTVGANPGHESAELASRVLRRAVLAAADEGATRFLLPGDTGRVHFTTEVSRDLHVRRPAGSWGRLLWAGRATRGLLTGFGNRLLPRRD
jgi:CelD/BcsL family acetyltransferase involved in cellulose biosynthesis